jgi:hypothetical protein
MGGKGREQFGKGLFPATVGTCRYRAIIVTAGKNLDDLAASVAFVFV